jgi:hypothetical protein
MTQDTLTPPMMTTTMPEPVVLPSSPLRWLADTYEQAQRVRIETGERIRAVVQGRDRTFEVYGELLPERELQPAMWRQEVGVGFAMTADDVLEGIAAGGTLGPVLLLGRTYRRHWEEEREMFKEMKAALKAHPVYPWLSRIKGIGPTLGCKLLARFDAERAPYSSSFWAYAGLDTVPGTLYRCEECGLERSYPPAYNVSGAHKRGGSGAACKGKLSAVVAAEVRVARPRHAAGEKASYDAYAKKILYLVGTSFLKAGGPYEQHYRRHRDRLETERPSWPDGRKHLTALRITEKLFLSHLWQVWRQALGLPTPRPWIEAHGGHDASSHIDPWSMVEEE